MMTLFTVGLDGVGIICSAWHLKFVGSNSAEVKGIKDKSLEAI